MIFPTYLRIIVVKLEFFLGEGKVSKYKINLVNTIYNMYTHYWSL